MFERFRVFRLRRHHGSEETERILATERALARMAPELRSTDWCAWLWKLPSEAWQEAVALRLLESSERERREGVVRAMSRLGRARQMALGDPAESAHEMETLKREAERHDREFGERRRRFAERWGNPPPDR